jgi:hypothetical protein
VPIRHHKAVAWEKALKRVFDRVDDQLEETYGQRFRRHPARPARGTTSNREHDGLFNVGAAFSPGFGSEHGAGYVIEVRISTLEKVPPELRGEIEEQAIRLLREELPRAFPGRKLEVARDGGAYKIFGDLGLGEV